MLGGVADAMDASSTVLVGISPVTTTATAGNGSALDTVVAGVDNFWVSSAAGILSVNLVLASAWDCWGGSCDCCFVSTPKLSALIKGRFSVGQFGPLLATGVALSMNRRAGNPDVKTVPGTVGAGVGSVNDGAGDSVLLCGTVVMAMAVALTSLPASE